MLSWVRRTATDAGRIPRVLAVGIVTVAVSFAVRVGLARLRSALPSSKTNPDVADAKGDCRIVTTKSILLILSSESGSAGEVVRDLAAEFCGAVITDLSRVPCLSNMTVYLCGDISKASSLGLQDAHKVYIIGEISHGYDHNAAWEVVHLGRVPILVHGIGVYFRRFFDLSVDCFSWISAEHAFQTLTESNKPGTAQRTGIYLTPVEQHGEEVHFRLLRCSTNFSGPTVNFGTSDKHIVSTLNEEVATVFQNQAPLNHVLAQIYHNMPATEDRKQTKAKIKAHSDKTKDMPENGLMAFCTFYEHLGRLEPLASDAFDYGHKKVSGLTKLSFRLKDCVAERPGCTLKPHFSVTLYPNSVFLMPLSANRLYTHEIRPPALDADLIPTRMGYVVRCSATEVLHKDAQTFFKMPGGGLAELEPATTEGLHCLRKLYAQENITDNIIDYSMYGPLRFSMNSGDYARPTVQSKVDEFRSLAVHTDDNLFEELFRSVQWQDVGKGRQGNVLVLPDETRGVPIVRTTTKYAIPAQCFLPVHARLAEQIQKRAWASAGFNNALIENYGNAYATMGFHSDQDLDLEEGTSIAVFSCYKHPNLVCPQRKLVVESKEPGGSSFEIPLTHNSVVVWSLETNRRYKHKIVLDGAAKAPENQWLGITFRTSKSFVQVRDGQACFEDGTPLTLADEEQSREFYKLRRRENEERNFAYPKLSYTISKSDMLSPNPAH